MFEVDITSDDKATQNELNACELVRRNLNSPFTLLIAQKLIFIAMLQNGMQIAVLLLVSKA